MKKLLFLIPFLLPIQGCNDANATSPPPSLEYEVLHESYYNGYADSTSKGSVVIRTKTDYDAELLKRSSEAIKSVDFAKERILLIDMGTRHTGGFDIYIKSFTEENEYIRAQVVLSIPDGTCVVTLGETNPYKMLKLETTKEILVTEEVEIKSC